MRRSRQESNPTQSGHPFRNQSWNSERFGNRDTGGRDFSGRDGLYEGHDYQGNTEGPMTGSQMGREGYRADSGRGHQGSDYGRQSERWGRPYQDDRFERTDRSTPERNSSYQNERGAGARYEREENRGGYFGKGPKGWSRSPERLKEEVCEALYRSPHVDASEIEVSVEDNTICLRGTVESREAKREAEDCITELSGVDDVRNELRVKKESGSANLRDVGKKANFS